MNGHAKRAEKAIRALGFELNEEITERRRNGKRYYTHPLAPAEPVTIYASLDEHAARCVIDRARQIAGMDSTNAKRRNAAVKERRRADAAKRREREQREATARAADDEKTAMQVAMLKAIEERDLHDREMRDLMMPGGSR